MSVNGKQDRHVVLTVNGVAGACAAAAVLMKHSDARIQLTSPRHLPKAMELLAAEAFTGTAHVCGIGISPPPEDLFASTKALAATATIAWYSGRGHPKLQQYAKALSRHAKLTFAETATDAEAIVRRLRTKKPACSLLIELAEEAMRNKTPRSEWHRFCHDLVHAGNRRFFFFGDDTLNEKAIRYLAGLEEKSHELDEVVDQYRRSPDSLYPLGSSPAMKALRQRIGKIGPVPEPVLVVGPTGSGKEVMAKALHITSGRTGDFVAVNCAVLGGNPALVEDRLFGHVKGAYTSAEAEAKGAFEEADGGTLLLDEIGELPVNVQAQLLRVLEDKEVRPVGAMKTRPVDVRIIAATHRDLGRMVRERLFREDLFYRINVLMVSVPPLRERPEDMKSIAAHVTTELEKSGYNLALNKKDWDAIRAFEWPGNVRQFLNVLKRAAYLDKSVEHVLREERTSQSDEKSDRHTDLLRVYCPSSSDEVVSAQDVYRAYLAHVLDLFDGNITRTAKALGIAPNTLRKHTVEGEK